MQQRTAGSIRQRAGAGAGSSAQPAVCSCAGPWTSDRSLAPSQVARSHDSAGITVTFSPLNGPAARRSPRAGGAELPAPQGNSAPPHARLLGGDDRHVAVGVHGSERAPKLRLVWHHALAPGRIAVRAIRADSGPERGLIRAHG